MFGLSPNVDLAAFRAAVPTWCVSSPASWCSSAATNRLLEQHTPSAGGTSTPTRSLQRSLPPSCALTAGWTRGMVQRWPPPSASRCEGERMEAATGWAGPGPAAGICLQHWHTCRGAQQKCTDACRSQQHCCGTHLLTTLPAAPCAAGQAAAGAAHQPAPAHASHRGGQASGQWQAGGAAAERLRLQVSSKAAGLACCWTR